MPSGPRRSKNAACGLTAAAWASTASRIPRQNSSAARGSGSPRRCSGNRAGTGSRPTTSGLSLRRADRASALTRAPSRHEKGPPGDTPGGSQKSSKRLLYVVFEGVAGGELRHLGGGDVYALLCLGVDALAGVALLDVELAEAGDLDLVARLELGLDHLGEGFEELLGFALRGVRLVGDLLDQLRLVHASSCLRLPLSLPSPKLSGGLYQRRFGASMPFSYPQIAHPKQTSEGESLQPFWGLVPTVEHRHDPCDLHPEPLELPRRPDGLGAGRDDVFDQDDLLAGFQLPLVGPAGGPPVLFGRLADDH